MSLSLVMRHTKPSNLLVANRLDSEAASQDDGQGGKFPSLFLCKEGASCCLMYLHGNAEDLGLSHDLLKAFR